MLENKSALELTGLAHSGASFEIDGLRYAALELIGIAHALSPGAHMKIYHSSARPTLELNSIAQAAPGRVTFT
jgi:hypothetical protein